MGVLPGFRTLGCGALLVFAAPGVARTVQIKADPNFNITRFRLVPPEVVEGLTGTRLRDKVMRFRPVLAPAPREVTVEWYLYPECDGNLSLIPHSLTEGMDKLEISCTRQR